MKWKVYQKNYCAIQLRIQVFSESRMGEYTIHEVETSPGNGEVSCQITIMPTTLDHVLANTCHYTISTS